MRYLIGLLFLVSCENGIKFNPPVVEPVAVTAATPPVDTRYCQATTSSTEDFDGIWRDDCIIDPTAGAPYASIQEVRICDGVYQYYYSYYATMADCAAGIYESETV